MTIDPDQLRVRIEAALITLQRLTEHASLGEAAHISLSTSEWHLTRALERARDEAARTPRRP